MKQIFVLYDNTDDEIPIGFYESLEAAKDAIEDHISREIDGQPPCSGIYDYDEVLLQVASCPMGEINPDHAIVLTRHWERRDDGHGETWNEVPA